MMMWDLSHPVESVPLRARSIKQHSSPRCAAVYFLSQTALGLVGFPEHPTGMGIDPACPALPQALSIPLLSWGHVWPRGRLGAWYRGGEAGKTRQHKWCQLGVGTSEPLRCSGSPKGCAGPY